MWLHTVVARQLQAIGTLFDCNAQPIPRINTSQDPGAADARNMFKKHIGKGLPKFKGPSVGTPTLPLMAWPNSSARSTASKAVSPASRPGSAISATGSNAASSTQAPSAASSSPSVYMGIPISTPKMDTNTDTPENNDPNINAGRYPDLLFPNLSPPHGTTQYHGCWNLDGGG
jgi:hypothetical protein